MKTALVVLLIWIVPVALRALPTGGTDKPQPINLPAITTLASNLSGRVVAVTCAGSSTTEGETLSQSRDGGITWAFDDTMRLNRDLCESLSGLIASPPHVDGNAGRAVLVVTHEAVHIRDLSMDEGVTECRAVRSLPETITLLPLSPDDARRVLADGQAEHDRQPKVVDGKPNVYRSVC